MTEKFIMAAGTALRVADSGMPRHATADDTVRPPLVLLHGYLESIEVWDDFAKLLTPHLRVIMLDLPGHGVSEVRGEIHTMEFLADTVHAALEALGVGRCVVCGHSMGGYAALELLRKYPATVAGIILFHSAPYADTDEKREKRRREIEVVLAGKKDLLAASVSRGFAPENRQRLASKIEEFADQVYLTEDAGVVALLRGMEARRDNGETLAGAGVPVMFIFGRGDEYVTPEVAGRMTREFPRAEVVWLENSGHTGFVEEPAKAAGAILEFCRTVE